MSMSNWVCAACGGDNPEGMNFCGHCGAPVVSAPATPDGDQGVADALRSFVAGPVADKLVEGGGTLPEERRLITALFADVSGFTSLADRLDPEQLLEVIDPVISGLSTVVGKYGGYVEKVAGDALMPLFCAPVCGRSPERQESGSRGLRRPSSSAQQQTALASFALAASRTAQVWRTGRISISSAERRVCARRRVQRTLELDSAKNCTPQALPKQRRTSRDCSGFPSTTTTSPDSSPRHSGVGCTTRFESGLRRWLPRPRSCSRSRTCTGPTPRRLRSLRS